MKSAAVATPMLPGFAMTFPPTVVRTGRPDGAVLVIPGQPVCDEEEVTVSQAVKLMGGHYKRRMIQKLARSLGARQRARGCKLRIPVRALAEMRARRAD